MDDDAGPHEELALKLQLELRLDRQPVSGRLRSERGAEEQFVGWLGFVDALKRLQERAPHPRARAATCPPRDRQQESPAKRKERP